MVGPANLALENLIQMTHLYSKEAVIRYTLRIDLAFCFMKPAFYVKEFEPDFQSV